MRSAALLAVLGAGCLPETEFHCTTHAQCFPGICQMSVGHCSDFDPTCDSQQRYDGAAGKYANECAFPAECPLPYTSMPGENPAHRYMAVMTPATWEMQRDLCAMTAANAYLVIPDGSSELSALVSKFGPTSFWVGINDQQVESAFIKIRGSGPLDVRWAPGQPDNGGEGGNEDCVAATDMTVSDEPCGDDRRAICECEPAPL